MSAYKVNRRRVQKAFENPSRAKQAFKDECDINNIMSRYEQTGLIEHIRVNQGRYVDAPSYEDFHQAMNLVTSATQMFDTLPASIRRDFNNDASLFLEFVSNEDNREAMVNYGLIDPAKIPEPPAGEPEPSGATITPENTNASREAS